MTQTHDYDLKTIRCILLVGTLTLIAGAVGHAQYQKYKAKESKKDQAKLMK